jgi:ATP-dependent protease ClpP protease subunit
MNPQKRKYSQYDAIRHKHKSFLNLPQFDIYRTGDTEIRFTCEVTEESIERLKKHMCDIIDENIDELDRVNKTESDDENSDSDDEKGPFVITYILNTGGGDLSACLSFVDHLNIIRNKYTNIVFESIITGTVASAGTIMAVVADRRKMTENATAMIHDLKTGYYGTGAHFKSYNKEVRASSRRMIKIYVKETGGDPENASDVKFMIKKLNKESWFNAEKYLKYGFIDSILKRKTPAVRTKRLKSKYVTKTKTNDDDDDDGGGGSETKDQVVVKRKSTRKRTKKK